MSSISSTIIENAIALREAESASVAYFYCDFRDADKQSRNNMLHSFIIQLSSRSTACCDILSRLYLKHECGAQKPSDATLTQCLKDMLIVLDSNPTYIIIDALDECPDAPGIPSAREQVLALVKELVNLRLDNLRICVTSRPEADIRSTLEPLALHSVSLHNQSGQKKDIVDYVRSVVYSDAETIMRRWKKEDKDLVIKTLSERAGGM
jgi:NACHT domain